MIQNSDKKSPIKDRIQQFKCELQEVHSRGFIVRMDDCCYKDAYNNIIKTGVEIFFDNFVNEDTLIKIKHRIENTYGFEFSELTDFRLNGVKIVLVKYGYEK
jgi:hypothetical protein